MVELEACRDYGLVVGATQDVADQGVNLLIPQNPAVRIIRLEQLRAVYTQQSETSL